MKNLEAVITAAKFYRDTSVLDCDIVVCDSEGRFLHHEHPITFSTANIKIGNIASGGPIKECISTKKVVKGMIPEHVYGIKLSSIIYPIFEDNGEFAGILGIATSYKTQAILQQATQSIATTSQEINMALAELSSSANQLSDCLLNVRQGGENVLSWVNKTNNILKFISEVADNSNLLGLNAAIEAARAGEQGRGFSVVAKEIRQMAVNSAQSVNEIKTILQNIHNEAKSVVDTMMNTAELGERQAASTEEIFASMQQLTASLNEIDQISKTL
ncbi:MULTISPECIES: methyl-accepting chemotaxis protein [Sporomusa]|jgi:uncharacterized protein YukE|uniref:methyl-accepting chemotaxis protein n=1 Tax=Sporomusa TaxID=2375 RepID=UPI00315978CA